MYYTFSCTQYSFMWDAVYYSYIWQQTGFPATFPFFIRAPCYVQSLMSDAQFVEASAVVEQPLLQRHGEGLFADPLCESGLLVRFRSFLVDFRLCATAAIPITRTLIRTAAFGWSSCTRWQWWTEQWKEAHNDEPNRLPRGVGRCFVQICHPHTHDSDGSIPARFGALPYFHRHTHSKATGRFIQRFSIGRSHRGEHLHRIK